MSETADGEAVTDTSDTRIQHHAKAHRNGHGAPAAEPPEEDAYARAEKTLDEMGAKAGRALATVGKHLTRWTMRAREEAEDILVEARDIHHRVSKRPKS